MDKRSIILLILVLGSLMAALDASIVLLAFPSMTQELSSDIVTSIWVILLYIIIVSVCTTQLGRLGDIFGRGKMFNLGFAIFTIASALCGLSPGILFLIFFRALQAVGSALLLANSGAIVADNFSKEHLGRAFGYIATGWSVGSVLGIILGGAITTLLGWRYIFYINVPIGIFALYLGLRHLKDKGKTKAALDVKGIVIFGIVLLMVSYGALDFAAQGLALFNEALIILGALLGLGFYIYEKNAKSPMIDFGAFRNRVLKYSTVSLIFISLGWFAVLFLITVYLQGVRGITPLNAAILISPTGLLGAVFSPFMGRLSDRIGARIVATTGIGFFALATLVYLTIGATTPLYMIAVAAVFSGIGLSMFFPANTSAIMANVRPDERGSINGLLRTIQNTGILLSYVIAFAIMTSVLPRETAYQIFVGTTQIIGGITDSFVSGIHAALALTLVLLIIGAVFSLIRGKNRF